MNELCKWHKIPLYGGYIEVVVSDDLAGSRNSKKRVRYLGKSDMEDTEAIVSWTGPIKSVFFKIGRIDHGIIAHEILHIASVTLDRAGVKFYGEDHESHTYLLQWITDKIYGDFERWRIPVPNDCRKGLGRIPRQSKKNKKLSKRPNKG